MRTYMTETAKFHLKQEARRIRDNKSASYDSMELVSILEKHINASVTAVYDRERGCHRFPVSEKEYKEEPFGYGFLLSDYVCITESEVDVAMRVAGYFRDEICFAMIGENVFVLLAADKAGKSRADLERAVLEIMKETVEDSPRFSTRTASDGWGMVFSGSHLFAMVPPEEIDKKTDSIPENVSKQWRERAVEACKNGDILLLAVPEGYEYLL